jgi:hypothetical protein
VIVVAERISAVWRARAADTKKPSILLHFATDVDHRVALDEIQRALLIVDDEMDATLDSFGEPMRAGQWSLMLVPGGVLLGVLGSDDLESVLSVVVAHLDARAIDGRFDLFEAPTVAEPPAVVDLIECRMRVDGVRFPRRGWNHGWRVDPVVFDAVLGRAIDWCLEGGEHAHLQLLTALLPPIPLELTAARAAVERERAEHPHWRMELCSSRGQDFRIVGIYAETGSLILLEAGETIKEHDWRPTVSSMCHLMRQASPLLAYAFVRRGWHRTVSRNSTSLSVDWPAPLDAAKWPVAGAFEDEWAPDALGVQLLGPKYAGRRPSNDQWRATALQDGRELVEHADPDAWFSSAFVPPPTQSARPRPQAVPPVLQKAREDFMPCLFQNSIVPRIPD